jgi:hypothetical protein
MAGLVPATHAIERLERPLARRRIVNLILSEGGRRQRRRQEQFTGMTAWMAGTSPAMTLRLPRIWSALCPRIATAKPDPNLTKFSQAGPSPRKEFPRKRLGFPWISLFELSLFKGLRGPLALKIFFGSTLPVGERRAAMACAPARALAVRRSALAPGCPMWLRSFITSHYSDVSIFVNHFCKVLPLTY